MVVVSVFTSGGNMFQGEMEENQATELINRWSSKRMQQQTLALSQKEETGTRLSFVQYDAIVAIDYLLGL